MNTPQLCKTCKKPKANHTCALCQDSICKSCTQFLTETFSYRKSVPKELTHSSYCMNCFDQWVATPLEEYNQVMDKAKEIIIYRKDQSKLTRNVNYKADPYSVEDCEDEEEALMRMSFFAVEAGHNCLIHVVLSFKKVMDGSHKKAVWAGTGIPVTIDPTTIRGHMDPP
ncbi:MAG TPA: hypothetical protein VNJ01_11760 [Bacteriovoracaceae bacterium]|nr:hypothetical protein [Bacteriovoracaceae bacterium]